MDDNKNAVLEKRIEKTMANLAKNKMKPYYAKDKQEALQLVEMGIVLSVSRQIPAPKAG